MRDNIKYPHLESVFSCTTSKTLYTSVSSLTIFCKMHFISSIISQVISGKMSYYFGYNSGTFHTDVNNLTRFSEICLD